MKMPSGAVRVEPRSTPSKVKTPTMTSSTGAMPDDPFVRTTPETSPVPVGSIKSRVCAVEVDVACGALNENVLGAGRETNTSYVPDGRNPTE